MNVPADVLLEVNISGDADETRLPPDEVEQHLPRIAALPNVDVLGLMTMASREGDADQARREFAAPRACAMSSGSICPDEDSAERTVDGHERRL